MIVKINKIEITILDYSIIIYLSIDRSIDTHSYAHAHAHAYSHAHHTHTDVRKFSDTQEYNEQKVWEHQIVKER